MKPRRKRITLESLSGKWRQKHKEYMDWFWRTEKKDWTTASKLAFEKVKLEIRAEEDRDSKKDSVTVGLF
jgi:hypothetical protein